MIKTENSSADPGDLKIIKRNHGFAIMFALVVGTIMLVLAVALYTFVGQQQTGIQTIVNGEVAHFLAEAGINSCIGNIRKTISENLAKTTSSSKISDLLLRPGEFDDVCINEMLGENWNKDLLEFAGEVGKDAVIKVDVWLKDFKNSETDSTLWSDPVARNGFLVIEATGEYKNARRVISIKRQVYVSNILPGFAGKFTFFVNNAAKNGESSFNLIRNDYRGMITDGPKPIIFYNHATPDATFEAGNMADILKNEKLKNIWQQRGWIWLGGSKIRLNLCSGAGDLGEIFHFYDVSNPNVFSPIKFSTPASVLPAAFSSSLQIPWDKSGTSVRQVNYRFGHSFVVDGFHDRSNRKESDAMYEGNILSASEKGIYTSRSSILHLFGDARKGFQSRTKVFGQVYAAFPRFANLEVKPEDADVAETFSVVNPPPLYLLPSISDAAYNNSVNIIEIMRRKVGGPLLKTGMLFKSYNEYAQLMSRICEAPYADSYNSMHDVYNGKTSRFFPSNAGILSLDNGENITVSRDNHTFFQGRPATSSLIQLLSGRTQLEINTISEFWERFLNNRGELELNAVVRIKNPRRLDMQIPESGRPQPLVVKGGGMIILEEGNIVLGGVRCMQPSEALTVVLKGNGSVSFSSTQPNHVNIIAPSAELTYGSKFDLYGSLCVGSVYSDHRFQGGVVRFRTGQDPQNPGYDRFYKVFVAPKDSYWNE